MTQPNSTAQKHIRESLFPFRRRCLWRHDYKLVSGVPEHPELRANRRRKLYKMVEVCARCGSQR